MKRIILPFLLALFTAHAASATLVDFDTLSSVLSCGTAANCSSGSGNVINFGLSTGGSATLQITYSANIESDLNVDPLSSTNFGQLFLLCVSCAGQTGTFGLTGAMLALNVSQGPDPFVDSGTFGNGMVGGVLSLTNGDFGGVAQVGWAAPNFMLSNGSLATSWVLQQPTPPMPAAYLLSLNAATTLQGLIATIPVPEPGTFGLLTCGLMALAIGRARKR